MRKKGKKNLTNLQWLEIRSKYEDVESCYTAPALAQEYGLTAAAVNYHARKEGWVSPKRIKRDVKRLAEQKEKAIRKEQVRSLAADYEKLREVNFDLAKKALEDFKKTRPVPKDFHEAVKAAQLAREAAGIVDDTGIRIGINLAGLSCASVEDVIDV